MRPSIGAREAAKANSEMKIGIEVQRLFRKKKFGIETSSLELIRALQEIEPDHQFVIFAKDDEDRACLTASRNLKIRTVGGKFFVDFEQILLPLAAKKEQVDILHCTGNTTPLFSPAPIVQTLHDVIFMDSIPWEDSFYQRFGNLYRRRVVPLVTPRSKVIITVSHYEKERIMQRLDIPAEKIHVVYNGINEKRFHRRYTEQQQESVRNKYNLPREFILFLGNQTTRKNPARAIEAYVKYAAATEQPLAFVTPGLSKKFVVQTLRHLQVTYDPARFITPGYIDDADLPLMYTLSQLFLFPSLSEGFGMPVIEAMACGAPVVSSNASCLPEIAGNAAMLANPLKADEMATAILTILQDSELRRKKIEAGIWNAKRFSWGQTAKNIMGIYEAVYIEANATQKQPRFLDKQVFATRD